MMKEKEKHEEREKENFSREIYGGCRPDREGEHVRCLSRKEGSGPRTSGLLCQHRVPWAHGISRHWYHQLRVFSWVTQGA